ncbi:MAG TPA: hypothetical protein VFW62_12730 [bacterium]|nr:hypothetical protein [bacterium]
MSILYVNAPAFAVAVERLRDPALRAVPLAVAAHDSSQAPLVSVSAEAYALGLRRGLKAGEAKRFECRLRIVPADPPRYERAQAKVQEVVRRYTPLYEAERLGSFFLDLGGTERLFGPALDVAAKIQAEIARALGLRATLGVGGSKLVSQIAANVVRPKGLCDVFPGAEAAFLAPLELDYLPALQEFADRASFQELALNRIGDLAQVPLPVLHQVFGAKSERLHLQALGVDPRPVEPPLAEEVLAREVDLPSETNDDAVLLAVLWRAVEVLGRELRQRRQMAAEARIEGLQGDLKRLTERVELQPPSASDFDLFAALEGKWRKFLRRRVTLKFLKLSFAKLCPAFRQAEIGVEPREERLLVELDRLREKYGVGIVTHGRGISFRRQIPPTPLFQRGGNCEAKPSPPFEKGG